MNDSPFEVDYLTRIQPDRWPAQKRAVFKSLGYCAVALLRTDHVAAVTLYQPNGREAGVIGGNRGAWPIRLATTAAWEDVLTPTYDRGPWDHISVIGRLWTASEERAKRLAARAAEYLALLSRAANGSDLENGYFDIGADVDWISLIDEIAEIGGRHGIQTWDDDDTAREVDRRYREMLASTNLNARRRR